MTHVCFTPPQPVLHGDCTPNLSPLLRLEQDPASPTAWERALARQGWGWHSHRGTKTGPFGGELLPLHPGTRSRTRCPVQAPGGERPRKTAAERSRRRLPFFSWIFLQCAAHSLGGKQRSVRGGGAASQLGPGDSSRAAWQQRALINHPATARRRKMRTAQLQELFKASLRARITLDTPDQHTESRLGGRELGLRLLSGQRRPPCSSAARHGHRAAP